MDGKLKHKDDNFMKENLTIFKKYQIKKKLGEGAFGDVYMGTCIETNELVAIKVEPKKIVKPLLETEAFFLYSLKGLGIPEVLSFGRIKNYNVLVEPLLDKSLFDIFNERRKRLPLEDICLIAIQIIDRIKWVHSKNIVHRDIKPDNFLIGRKDPNIIYLIDFGLSKKYRSSKTNKHLRFGFTGKLTGTVRFASANALRGGEQSRRDDLESIGYMLIYFMRGKLPWQGVTGEKKIERYLKIYKMKKNVSPEDLCKSLPRQMVEFMRYIKQLEFEQDPDYKYLRGLFESILKKRNESNDQLIFSWIKLDDFPNLKNPVNPATRRDSPQSRLYRKIQKNLDNEHKRNNSSDKDSAQKSFKTLTVTMNSNIGKLNNYNNKDLEIETSNKKLKSKEGLNTMVTNLNQTLDEIIVEDFDKPSSNDFGTFNLIKEEREKKKLIKKKNHTVNEVINYKNNYNNYNEQQKSVATDDTIQKLNSYNISENIEDKINKKNSNETNAQSQPIELDNNCKKEENNIKIPKDKGKEVEINKSQDFDNNNININMIDNKNIKNENINNLTYNKKNKLYRSTNVEMINKKDNSQKCINEDNNNIFINKKNNIYNSVKIINDENKYNDFPNIKENSNYNSNQNTAKANDILNSNNLINNMNNSNHNNNINHPLNQNQNNNIRLPFNQNDENIQDILENKRYNKNNATMKKINDKNNNNLNIKEKIPNDSYQNNIINLNPYEFKRKNENKSIQIKGNLHNSNIKRICEKGLASDSKRESPNDNIRQKKVKNIKRLKKQPMDKMNTYNSGDNFPKNININTNTNFNDSIKKENIKNINLNSLDINNLHMNTNINNNFNNSIKKENIKNLNLDNLEFNNLNSNFNKNKINNAKYNTNNNTTKNNEFIKKYGFSQKMPEDGKIKNYQNLQLMPKNSDDIEQNENQEFFNINFQNQNNSKNNNINNTRNNQKNQIKNNNINNYDIIKKMSRNNINLNEKINLNSNNKDNNKNINININKTTSNVINTNNNMNINLKGKNNNPNVKKVYINRIRNMKNINCMNSKNNLNNNNDYNLDQNYNIDLMNSLDKKQILQQRNINPEIINKMINGKNQINMNINNNINNNIIINNNINNNVIRNNSRNNYQKIDPILYVLNKRQSHNIKKNMNSFNNININQMEYNKRPSYNIKYNNNYPYLNQMGVEKRPSYNTNINISNFLNNNNSNSNSAMKEGNIKIKKLNSSNNNNFYKQIQINNNFNENNNIRNYPENQLNVNNIINPNNTFGSSQLMKNNLINKINQQNQLISYKNIQSKSPLNTPEIFSMSFKKNQMQNKNYHLTENNIQKSRNTSTEIKQKPNSFLEQYEQLDSNKKYFYAQFNPLNQLNSINPNNNNIELNNS